MRTRIRWGKGSESGVTRRGGSAQLSTQHSAWVVRLGFEQKGKRSEGQRWSTVLCFSINVFMSKSTVYSVKGNSLSIDEVQHSLVLNLKV